MFLSEEAIAWGRAEWAQRKVEIAAVYDGAAGWEDAHNAQDIRLQSSGLHEQTAIRAIIHAQQADTDAERDRLATKVKNYIGGYC